MDWYVLQVSTGKEVSIADKLEKKGLTAKVPQEYYPIHKAGKWREVIKTLMPGYVFIGCLPFTAEVYYTAHSVDGVYKVLGQIAPDEAAFWGLNLPEQILPASTVQRLEDGRYHVLSGRLQGQETRIVKVDRHRRRIKVRVPMPHSNKLIEFPLQLFGDNDAKK